MFFITYKIYVSRLKNKKVMFSILSFDFKVPILRKKSPAEKRLKTRLWSSDVKGGLQRFRSSLFTLSGIVARKHSCTFLDAAASLIKRLPSYFICLWNIYVRSKQTLWRKNQLRNGWEIASRTQQRHLLWSHSADTVTWRHGRLPSLPLQCG